MRTDYPHIKIKRGIGPESILAVLFLLLLSSCTKDKDTLPDTPDGKGQCEATIRLDVGAFGMNGRAGTRAFVGGTDDENRINNIWVFQYNVETGKLMHVAYCDDFDSNDIKTDLDPNKNGEHSVVCIVANVGEFIDAEKKETWVPNEQNDTIEDFQTYENFLTQVIPALATQPFISSNMGEEENNGKVIPMFGESKQMVIASKCYVSVPLVRMFARVSVHVDLADLIELENITFQNIPSYCRVSSLVKDDDKTEPAQYPEDIEWTSYDAGKVDEVILYFPENLQGTVAGMINKEETDNYKIPEHALRVKLTVSYEKDGENKTTYKVYPGLDMDSDFNIMRNNIYNVSITINKLPEE